MKMIFSQRIFLNAFFVAILIVILITTFFSYRQINKVSISNEWVKHTCQVIETTNNMLLAIMEVESVTRGYLISGDVSFIENIDKKIKNIFDVLNLAKKITNDSSKEQILLGKVESLLIDRINIMKKTINLKLSNKFGSDVALPLMRQGQNLTVRIKEIIISIYENETELLRQREKDFIQNFNVTNNFYNSVNVINIIILFVIIVFFNKMMSNLRKTQNLAKQSESLLKGIIGGSKEYIAAFDLNYNFLLFNEAFELKFQDLYGKSIAIGMNLKDELVNYPEDQKKMLDILGRALKGEEFTIVEEFCSDKKIINQFEMTYSSIYNEKNELIGSSVIARDVGKSIEEKNKLKRSNEKLEISLRKVEKQAKEMEIISDMNNKLRSGVTMEESLSMISWYLKKVLPFSSGVIYLMNNSKNYLESVSEWSEPNVTEKIFSPDQCWGLRQGKTYFYVNENESIPCKHTEGQNHSKPYFCVPLLALNEVVGILYLQITQSINMPQSGIIKLYEDNNLMIQNMADQISLAISNIKLQEILKSRSSRDLLTNLFNRTYLNETFERDIQRAKRNNSSVAIVMMDLDFFKKVNDNYGHKSGDIVLQEISKLIIAQLRKSDIACRYGGEEIIIILYDTLLKDAMEKTEELREKISQLEFNFVDSLTITASFGIAMFPEHGENPNELIEAADEALYYSKKNGRNVITVYSNKGKGNKSGI